MENKEYRVTWEIDLWARSPKDAAQTALDIMRDPESTATVFNVTNAQGYTVSVDLVWEAEKPHEIVQGLTWLDGLALLCHMRLDLIDNIDAWDIACDCFDEVLKESGISKEAFNARYRTALIAEWRISRDRRLK